VCNAEAPSVEEDAKKLAGKITIIGVAWSGTEKSFQGFVDKYKLSFPNLSDNDGQVFAHFGVPGQPAWVFIDSTGKATKKIGALSSDKVEQIVNDLA
jgi:peroxiredoxin